MLKLGLRGALFALGVLAMAVVAACGGSDSGGGGGKSGGSIKIGSVLPDEYDPVMFQTVQANEPLQLVYKGLVDLRGRGGHRRATS